MTFQISICGHKYTTALALTPFPLKANWIGVDYVELELTVAPKLFCRLLWNWAVRLNFNNFFVKYHRKLIFSCLLQIFRCKFICCFSNNDSVSSHHMFQFSYLNTTLWNVVNCQCSDSSNVRCHFFCLFQFWNSRASVVLFT